MNIWKNHRIEIVTSLLELLVGVILLLRPVGFTSTIILIAGAAAVLKGLWCIVRYFRTSPAIGQTQQHLAKGLLLLLAGGLCMLRTDWLLATFPVMTVLYGAALLVMAMYKIQRTTDMLRQKQQGWMWIGLSAVLGVVFAVIILLNPFASTAMLWTFTAIGLIAEAVTDVLFILFDIRKKA